MANNNDIAIKITGLKKRYRLGTIGGGTLQGDIQSWWARVRKKEDPNLKIGQKRGNKNEIFMALDGIDLTVKKGERLGIIGHNGAGKSTLLKLLSRVTAPTEGEICIDGRISSMLEVGTGFNGELTGRENIYLNGAILGMSKTEVDSKIDAIIEFSECEQFIDTPVKRYSSGMYVKLAFAVAAHLDSEILIMDEVLAVGDMKFQQKCLGKMSDVSQSEGRTVLYVSHNMNTIRQLCDRCIVLDHGKVVFDGDVEQAIEIYSNYNEVSSKTEGDLTTLKRYFLVSTNRKVSFTRFRLLDKDINKYCNSEMLQVELNIDAERSVDNAIIRFTFSNRAGTKIASAFSKNPIKLTKGKNIATIGIPLENFVDGKYSVDLVLGEKNEFDTISEIDVVPKAFDLQIANLDGFSNWPISVWGLVRLSDFECLMLQTRDEIN